MESAAYYANIVSALSSTGMLIIWSAYAWLFYQEFLRQRGCQLYIQEVGGGGSNSQCVLVNLSKEPVHVVCSLAASDAVMVRLHDTADAANESSFQREKQGPLGAGESMTLASFTQIHHFINDPNRPPDDAQSVEIRVAALHGSREWPVGAMRRFKIDKNASWVTPDMNHTEQLHSRRQSQAVREWLSRCHDRSG